MVSWDTLPHWAKVKHFMLALRENWAEGRRSSALRLLYEEIAAAREEGIADKSWLNAVKANADNFDGVFIDGRIFRDGHTYLPDEVAQAMSLPKSAGDPDGLTSVSGNLMTWFPGHRRVQGEGLWYGSYDESPVPEGTPDPGEPVDCPAGDCLQHD